MPSIQPKANRRYVERTVEELHDGDPFSLDDGQTWHVATGIAHSDMVVVAHDSGGTVRVPATADQKCWVQVDYVKIRIPLTVEVDVAAWAAEYGVDNTLADVEADARAYFGSPGELIPEHLRKIVKVAE
jgi:hypothetical protein